MPLAVGSSEDLLSEALEILRLINLDFNIEPVRKIYDVVERLYNGDFPGYRACNTGYHDLRHALETFLAMSRLIHGAVLDGESIDERQIITALIAAILHDVGYIQEESDTQGTGAKHKLNHEQRSIEFLNRHGFEFGLCADEIADGCMMIMCTDINIDLKTITFPSPAVELLGKLLGAADLMAQLSEKEYLEKLLYLYHECKEAGTGDYKSEVDILHKAIDFYSFFEERLKTALGGVDRLMQLHFTSKWGIKRNLYHEAIHKQKNYLVKILKIPGGDPRDFLKHVDLVKKIRKQYPK